jgi:pimeloyl-ACP methyl ester carboxylesterase
VIEAGGLAYDRYQVNNRDEWLMRIGPADGPPILFLAPLFEEMNRTRALFAATMRALADRGFGCWLPDLPGTGESERALEECEWDDWAAASAAMAERFDGRAVVVSFRGGCLLDGVKAACRWRMSPVDGASLTRDLKRTGLVSGWAQGGYSLSPTLLASLEQAQPAELQPLRTVRLRSDPRPADAKIEGPALWRRSEPGSSQALSQSLAADIADWTSQCAVS